MPPSSPMLPPSDPSSMLSELRPSQSSARMPRPPGLAEGHALSRWDPKQATSREDALVIFANVLGDAQIAIDDVLIGLTSEQRAQIRPLVEGLRRHLGELYRDLLRVRTDERTRERDISGGA